MGTPATNKVLTVEEMLDAQDTLYDEVDAWGAKVRIGSLDAGTILDFVETNDGPAKKTAGLRLLIASLVDQQGTRIGNNTMLERFKRKDHQTIEKLVAAVLKLNGLQTKKMAKDEAEKLETAAKNGSGEA